MTFNSVTTTYHKLHRGVGGVHISDPANKIETDILGHVNGEHLVGHWVDEDLNVHESTVVDAQPFRVAAGAKVKLTVPVGSWIEFNSRELVQNTKSEMVITRDLPEIMSYRFVGEYHSDHQLIVFYDLSNEKQRYIDKVAAIAETKRGEVSNLTAGQVMTYQAKLDAAQAFLSGATLTDTQDMWMRSEMDRTGASMEDAAKGIVTASEKMNQALAQIEATRLATKTAIQTAADMDEIIAIYESIVW